MYKRQVLEYDYETLNRRLREEAFLNAGVRITLTDDRPGHEDADGKPTDVYKRQGKGRPAAEPESLARIKGDATNVGTSLARGLSLIHI